MSIFVAKYEVQKGRTCLTLMGTAHPGGIVTAENFSKGIKMIEELVKLGTLKAVPLTEVEKSALVEAASEAKAAKKKTLEEEAASEERKNAILEVDFDDMNKDPMIEFAKNHEIELKATLADDIRDELKALQDSFKLTE